MLFNAYIFQNKTWRVPAHREEEQFWNEAIGLPINPFPRNVSPAPMENKDSDYDSDFREFSPFRPLLGQDGGMGDMDDFYDEFPRVLDPSDDEIDSDHAISHPNSDFDSVSVGNVSDVSSEANFDENADYCESVLKRNLPEAVWE